MEGKKIIGDFTIFEKDKIGGGAFGTVYKSSKESDSKKYITKVIFFKNFENVNTAKKYIDREIDVLKSTNHQNLLKYIDSQIIDDKAYIHTEYYNGGDLKHNLLEYKKKNEGKLFTEEITQYIIKQVVEGLKYLHGRRIIHRDLKLENILLNYEDEKDIGNIMKSKIKIIDFGFAKKLDGKDKLTFSRVGTPNYMDPRILRSITRGKDFKDKDFSYGKDVDLWSLGTVVFLMLIGFPFFDDFHKNEKKEGKNILFEGKFDEEISLGRETISFINGMLETDPKKRATAEQLSKHDFLTKNVNEFSKVKIELKDVDNILECKGHWNNCRNGEFLSKIKFEEYLEPNNLSIIKDEDIEELFESANENFFNDDFLSIPIISETDNYKLFKINQDFELDNLEEPKN